MNLLCQHSPTGHLTGSGVNGTTPLTFQFMKWEKPDVESYDARSSASSGGVGRPLVLEASGKPTQKQSGPGYRGGLGGSLTTSFDASDKTQVPQVRLSYEEQSFNDCASWLA